MENQEWLVGRSLPSLEIHPINTASGSKGSIHDDEKAREMGYAGGLVPGVTVLGYMDRLMHETFKTNWGPNSRFNGRLRRPVYEGAEVTVEGEIVRVSAAADDSEVEVELRVRLGDGEIAALGSAACKVRTNG